MTENVRAQVFLSAKTGIAPGHHKYFASDDAAKNFFYGKKVLEYSNLLVVRKVPSKHGYNVDCVHLKCHLSDVENCEYLSYFNGSLSKRWFHNRIVSIEYVNPESCRVHFTIDYYATYIGSCMSTLGDAFLVRGHVRKSEDAVNRFLLAEPVNVPMVYNVDPSAPVFLNPINEKMALDSYCVFSASDEKENTNSDSVGIQTQGGVDVYGTVARKTKVEVEQFIKTQTNQISTFQSMTKPMLSNVQAVKKMPAELVDSKTPITLESAFTPILPGYKHAKMYSPQFLFWRIFAISSGSHQQFDTTLTVPVGNSPPVLAFTFRFIMTGGLNATAALFFDRLELAEDMESQFIQQLPFPNVAIDSYQTPDYTTYGMVQRLALQPVGGGIGGALAGGAVGGPWGAAVGAAAGAVRGIASGVADVYGQTPQTYQTVGTATTDFAMAASLYRFEIVRYNPSSGGLKTLESFFDTWGYVVNENRALSLNVRSNFTHIQTRNAAVKGSAPAQALEAINAMFNAGVTIWQVEIGSTTDCGS